MTRQLFLVHGRAQQARDSVALKREWIDAWRAGLAKGGLDLPIAEADIRFPYYGDTLQDLVRGVSADRVAEVVTRGATEDAAARAFMQAILDEVRAKAGVTDAQIEAELGSDVAERGVLNVGWVQAVLSAIDRHVPFGSGASIAAFTNDVYQYLRNPGIAARIDAGVRAEIRADVETVVVGHSLGSVVAYNLLRRDGKQLGWKVPTFVTLGSPLGVTMIRKSLAPIEHPACVGTWFNAFDPADVVALHPLDRAHFGIRPGVENHDAVHNHTENRHGIAGYLDDPVVARRIHDALVA